MRRPNGFTLVEILVSITIIAIISVVVVQAFVSIIRVNTKTEALKEVKQNGEYVLSVLTRKIQNSTEITSTCDGTNVNTLQVIKRNTDGTTEYDSVFSINSGVIYLAEGAGAPEKIISDRVYAEILTFNCTEVREQPARVTVRFVLRQNTIGAATFETARQVFRDTIQTRNLYL
ncbi:hypothetical protein A2Z33_01140 [Candidatus Gottesmanbacteria bacterium RBG_16_52_11]|uniref:Prepilin-type N-terminal cleavage/methylation domain-containing protein n=1 Tax=Candidatus Gottesmanbacteria bacterium RBG_16_52_11 TaxID=1798374 RepID=A0A1F5YNR5_9BACT|nr:MAG: hypothetical protein A2Z33_01140 [Candidatus Gottesmanbacteria bacterium RBG_16_52_11]